MRSIVPGGFAHGDYLRPGAIARFSPVMAAVPDFAADGGPVVGICNGFQVLTEAGLLPGALQKNRGLKFLCTTVEAAGRVDGFGAHVGRDGGSDPAHPDQPLRGQLHLFAGDAGRAAGRRSRRAALRRQPEWIGRRHRRDLLDGRNVVGLMPHPERACDALLGSTDGVPLLRLAARAACLRSGRPSDGRPSRDGQPAAG